jgi:PAS domain S-box-containing protein
MASTKPIRVLLVDDDEDDYILTREIFSEIPQRENYKLTWIDNYEEAINAMLKSHHDIYLVDYRLGKYTGLDLLHEAIKSNVDEPIIILTGKGDSKVDEEALQKGAADYLVKDQIDPYTIERSLRYALKHKLTLKALRESENKFRIIFERSKEPFLILDSTGAVRDINNAGLSFFEYSKEEVSNLNSSQFFNNKQDSVRFAELIDEKGAVNDFETELKSSSNIIRKVSISAFLQIDQHATEELYYCIVHDITTLKEEERAYVNAEKLAVTERIAKSLANEIINPLSNINLSLEQLKLELGPNEGSSDVYLEIIKNNFERINMLITDFINSTQSVELNIQPKSINILIDESLEYVAEDLKANHIKVIKNYNETDLFVKVDFDKMANTFFHLLSNAIAANASEISLNIKSEDDFAIISVKDNGEGITLENQKRIFEPFFTTKQKSLGLGLTNAQKSIINHKGSLDFESIELIGTTFIIKLPLASHDEIFSFS